jgi:uncharacterized membrane protein SpoIIM required for sporulation
VIIDVARFVTSERAYWSELESQLAQIENSPERTLTLREVVRLHYLYERCSADLSRLGALASDPRLRSYLESLVARAYAEIHETRAPFKLSWRSIVMAFPRAFRRNLGAFRLSLAATLAGCAFGVFAVLQDPSSKAVLMPFPGLMESPAKRVAREETSQTDKLHGAHATFSAQLMTHNIQITMLAMASGITWGVGTLILLFYNGVILGAVVADYIAGGQGVFLAGWLLPHGSIEIPAILIGGQAGFLIAGALIGWGSGETRAERFRAIGPDLFALIGGAAALLVWAGLIEAFVSQYHQPVIPYSLKIAFGVCELAVLAIFLSAAGRPSTPGAPTKHSLQKSV